MTTSEEPNGERITVHDGDGQKVEYISIEYFKRWRKRALIAFIFLTAVSTLAAYLSFSAGQKSTEVETSAVRRAADHSDREIVRSQRSGCELNNRTIRRQVRRYLAQEDRINRNVDPDLFPSIPEETFKALQNQLSGLRRDSVKALKDVDCAEEYPFPRPASDQAQQKKRSP